jgi:hypothetical protein
MNKRFWLWLLLALLIPPQMATAQPFRHHRRRFDPPLHEQSHRPLPGPDSASEELMTQRMQEMRELHKLPDHVQDLLKDRELLKRIPGVWNLSDSEWQRLLEKMRKGEGLSQDPIWAKLRQQMEQRKWDDFLRSLAERIEHQQPFPREGLLPNTQSPVALPPAAFAPGSPAPPPSLPTAAKPGPSLFDRLQEKTTKWLIEELDDVGGDALQTLAEVGGNEANSPLAELLRSVPQSDFSGININEHPLVPTLRSGTFSRYLSNAGDFLHRQSGIWDGMGSLFREAPLPSLPRFRGPSVSMPAAAAAEGDGWIPMLLSLLLLWMIGLLLYKRGLGSKAPLGSGADAPWRLGSWPVAPGAVATRQDVIRAFEYLALVRFGPAAAACHHRQLAERLAEQDNANPGRRQAAEMLAWLYEQARYAPAAETLSSEQLSDARHALCFLAGVTTA